MGGVAVRAVFAVWAFWPKKDVGLFGNRTFQPGSPATSTPAVPAAFSPPAPVAAPASVPASAEKKVDFGPLSDKSISITGILQSAKVLQVVFTVSDGNRQLFTATSCLIGPTSPRSLDKKDGIYARHPSFHLKFIVLKWKWNEAMAGEGSQASDQIDAKASSLTPGVGFFAASRAPCRQISRRGQGQAANAAFGKTPRRP